MPLFTLCKVQGDHLRCSQPPIDIKTKVLFQYKEHELNRSLCFEVNGTLGTMCMVTQKT